MSKLIEATEVKRLEDGVHKGVIIGVDDRVVKDKKRDEEYDYTDIVFESEGVKISVSYPSAINEKSGLGKLLARFGISIVPGTKCDVEKLLIGKAGQFQTNEEGDFVKIIKGTEKLLKD